MGGEFTVDPNALVRFAQQIGMTNPTGSANGAAATGAGAGGQTIAQQVVQLPAKYKLTVDFGQGDPDKVAPNGFTDANLLWDKYHGQYQNIVGDAVFENSLAQFAAKLSLLADAASRIAKKYQDAQEHDVMGVADIDNQLNGT